VVLSETNPVEGVCIGIIDLIQQIEEIKLFKIFGGE